MTTLITVEYIFNAVVRCITHIIDRNDISVFTGAACGAAIFILNLPQTDRLRRICYFLISFFLGSNCAESATSLLNRGAEKFITPAPEINKTFTAALTAAIAVRLITKLSDLLLKKITDKK
jgi:Putative phage holin